MLKLKHLKLKSEKECVENRHIFLEDVDFILNHNDTYVILGEVGDTNHYIVLNINTGQIVPGMVHLERFEEVIDY